jgi:hypothetical protein
LTVNNFVLGISYPAGLFVQGFIADSTSLRTITIGSGALLAALLLAGRVLRPHHTEPIAIAIN